MLGSVAHQATGHDGLAHGIARRQRMASRQRDEPFPMGVQERAGTDEQRTGPALDERCKGCLDVAVAADIENDELLPDRLRRGLHVSSLRLGFRTVRVHQHGNCRRLGHELAQQLQSLRPQHAGEKTTPVTLPPGRLRLATRPSLTGSLPVAKTIGTVVVAALAASAEGVFPTITATGRRINSATRAGNRSG